MKAFFKRYAVIICLALCVLALITSWLGIRLSADSGTFRLDDIEGDRGYLNGINIAMTLSDQAHSQNIALSSGEFSHTYQYISPLVRPNISSCIIRQTFVEDQSADTQVDIDTKPLTSEDDYEIWRTRMTRTADQARISVSVEQNHFMGSYSQTNWVQVVTDVIVKSKDKPFVFKLEKETTVNKNQTNEQGVPLPDVTSDMPFTYGFTNESDGVIEEPYKDYEAETGYNQPLYAEDENGTVYFAPALRPYHSGTGAIYRVDKWGSYDYVEEPKTKDGYLSYSDINARPVGTITELASIPIDGHQMRTVALDVVDNRLCMLLIEDGMLTLRVYSMEGALEYQTALFDADPAQGISSMLYSNKSGGDTMLCYYLQDISSYDENGNPLGTGENKLCCIRLGEKAELVSTLTGKNVWRAAFIGGHWILAEPEIKETFSYYGSNITGHMTSCISILDSTGKTLYKGKLITDEAEDMTQYYLITDTGDYSDNVFTMNRLLRFEDISEE